jgi:hypothetical protein
MTEDTQAIVAAILAAVRIMQQGIPGPHQLAALTKPNIARCLIGCKIPTAQNRPIGHKQATMLVTLTSRTSISVRSRIYRASPWWRRWFR